MKRTESLLHPHEKNRPFSYHPDPYWSAGLSENPRWKVFGKPSGESDSTCVGKPLPRNFLPGCGFIASRLTDSLQGQFPSHVLCAFRDKDRIEQSTNGVTFQSGTVHENCPSPSFREPLTIRTAGMRISPRTCSRRSNRNAGVEAVEEASPTIRHQPCGG